MSCVRESFCDALTLTWLIEVASGGKAAKLAGIINMSKTNRSRNETGKVNTTVDDM